jgi:hypothetical protein
MPPLKLHIWQMPNYIYRQADRVRGNAGQLSESASAAVRERPWPLCPFWVVLEAETEVGRVPARMFGSVCYCPYFELHKSSPQPCVLLL